MIEKKNYSLRAQALVEMALLMMILVIITMLVLDIGRAFYYYTVVSNAAREGARYGIIHPTNSSGIINSVEERAIGLAVDELDISIDSDDCDTVDDCVITVSVGYEFESVTPLLWSVFGLDIFTVTGTSTMRQEY